jgi:hypothetical protein
MTVNKLKTNNNSESTKALLATAPSDTSTKMTQGWKDGVAARRDPREYYWKGSTPVSEKVDYKGGTMNETVAARSRKGLMKKDS